MKDKSTSAEEVHKAKKKGLKLPKVKIGQGKLIILGFLFILIAFLSTIGVLLYRNNNESPFIKGVTMVLPYPAAFAQGRFVSAYNYLDQMTILKNYYVNFKKTDFKSEDGKSRLQEIRKEVIDRLTEDAIVSVEARKAKVSVSKQDLNDSFDKLVTSNGGRKDFSEILSKYYGLTIEEFKNKIYKPRMLREKLTEKINSEEEATGASKKRADEVYNQIKSGGDFAQIAKENSGDQATAANGGDLGFFGKGKMVPEFEEAAFKLGIGDISEPVRTVYGYHIIKVTEKKGDEIKASHILIKVRDFNEWLAEKKEELKKKKYLGIIPGIWTLLP